jgi:flagellar assembly factor FliW
MPAVRHVASSFGPLEVPAEQVLHFAQGLLGFAECREWVLLARGDAHSMWLQSIEHPELALLLIDPFVAFDGFALDVPATASAQLDAGHADDVLVLAPVTMARGNAPATANLRGPVLINWRARRGVQVVVDGGPWGVRETIRGELLGG